MTPRDASVSAIPPYFSLQSEPKIPPNVFKNWLPQLKHSVSRWIRLFSAANDQFSESEKLEPGLVKSVGPQLQPSDILLPSHLNVFNILLHSHPHTHRGTWSLATFLVWRKRLGSHQIPTSVGF